MNPRTLQADEILSRNSPKARSYAAVAEDDPSDDLNRFVNAVAELPMRGSQRAPIQARGEARLGRNIRFSPEYKHVDPALLLC